jgi:hypothetical protein
MYRITEDQLGFSTNGNSRLTISTSAIPSTLPYLAPGESTAAPSLSFPSNRDTKVCRISTYRIGFSASGTETLSLSASTNNSALIQSSPTIKTISRNGG